MNGWGNINFVFAEQLEGELFFHRANGHRLIKND